MKYFCVTSLLLISCVIRTYAALPDPKGFYSFHPNVRTTFTSSSLPIIVIDLNEKMIDNSNDNGIRTSANIKVLWNRTGEENKVTDSPGIYNYGGPIEIRFRGNTSFMFSPKKGLNIRLRNAAGSKVSTSMLGMASDDEWTLLGPYNDKSMIRDMLVYILMDGTLDYVPTGRYCELVINGIYQGVYVMAARVRQGDNRLNMKKPSNATVAGLRGYHLEIDRREFPYIENSTPLKDLYDNNVNRSAYYTLKYPDWEDLSPAQWDAIQYDVWNMEQAIAGNDWNDPNQGYRAHFDTISAMDHFIAQEIARNIDGYRLSTSIYKDMTSNPTRFKFSIWDFNPSMGNGDYVSGWSTEGWAVNCNQYDDGTIPQFFKRMLQDNVFYANLGKRWTEYRKHKMSDARVTQVIDSLVNLLKAPAVRNYATWGYPVTPWPNYYKAASWEEETDYLRNWIKLRMKWLDSQWSAAVVNKVANGTFDAAIAKTPGGTDAVLCDWMTQGNVGLTAAEQHVYGGKYALSMYPDRKVWQTVTELKPGKYTFRCLVKTQGDPKATVSILYHKKNGTGSITETIRNNPYYYQVAITDIEVENHFAEILFETGVAIGDLRLWIDNVSFFRQPGQDPTDIQVPKASLNVKINRINNGLEIETENADRNTRIDVFDVMGNTVYSGYVNAPTVTIEGRFAGNKLYIVRVGDVVEKVIF